MKSRQPTEHANNKSVFVGGIPSHLTAEDIHEIFSSYGRVLHVKMAFKKGQPLMNNGYCVLTMATSQDATTIMQIRKIPIGQERFAICKPFMTGSNLESFRHRHNRLKVIIKGIPQQLSEERLRSFFEAEVGALEEVFIFQSDKPLVRTPKHKLVQSARVTFTHQNQVKHFFEAGDFETEVLIDGFYVKLELFRPDYKIPKKKVSKSDTCDGEQHAVTAVEETSERKILSLPSCDFRSVNYRHQAEPERQSKVLEVLHPVPQLASEESNLRFNMSKGSSLAIYRRIDFLQLDRLRSSQEEKYASKQTMSSQ